MKLSVGLIVVIISIVIFYIRVAILRGRKKRYEREYALKRRKVNGRSKGSPLPAKTPWTPPYLVSSWLLVVIAILLILVGVVVYNNFSMFGINLVNNMDIVKTYAQFWYIPVAAGIILLSFCVTIQKPRLD